MVLTSVLLVCINDSAKSFPCHFLFVTYLVQLLRFFLISFLLDYVLFEFVPVASIPKVPSKELTRGVNSVSRLPSPVTLVGLFPPIDIILVTIVASIQQKMSVAEGKMPRKAMIFERFSNSVLISPNIHLPILNESIVIKIVDQHRRERWSHDQ